MTDEQIAFYAEQFDRCWPWLEKAVDAYGKTHGKEDVWAAILTGDAQLWPLPASAMVTTIDVHPTGLKEVRGWLSGGDLEQIQAFVPQIEAWGRQHGCARATITGRRGWLRAFTGYREAAVLMTKEL